MLAVGVLVLPATGVTLLPPLVAITMITMRAMNRPLPMSRARRTRWRRGGLGCPMVSDGGGVRSGRAGAGWGGHAVLTGSPHGDSR